MKKNNLIFVLAASFFSIAAASVLVAKAATTWQGPPSNCTSPSQPGCNVDGVIWNTDQPQDARFNITGKGVVGGGLDVSNSLSIKNGASTNFSIDNTGGARNNYTEIMPDGDVRLSTGKALRADVPGASSLLNIGNFSPTGKYVDVSIYGNLQLHKTPANLTPSICFDDTDPTTCRTTWPSGGGFTQAQADLLYVKKAGDTMTGDLTTGNLYANTSISAGNVISAPTLSLSKSGQTSSATLNNNFWSFNGDLGNTQYQPTSLVMTAKTWSGNKLISLDMRSLGNFNTTIGSASFGDQDNPGVFTRTGGGKTAEVAILSNSGGETWGSMTGIVSNVPNAASTYAGNFKYADNSRQVMLVTPTYAMDVKGDANFQNQICLGGSCKNAWPAGTLTGPTVNGGLQLNGGTTLSIQNCAAGQIMKSTGISTWSCQADNSNSGTITGVTAGTMLTGGGASGAVTLSVDTTQTDARYIKKTGETGDLDVPNNKFGVGGTNYSTGSCYLDSGSFNAGATSRRGCVTKPGYFMAGIEYSNTTPYPIAGVWCCPL